MAGHVLRVSSVVELFGSCNEAPSKGIGDDSRDASQDPPSTRK